MRLHDRWPSCAAYWVRIVLNLKGLGYDEAQHDLRTGAQRCAEYARLNSRMPLPSPAAPELAATAAAHPDHQSGAAQR